MKKNFTKVIAMFIMFSLLSGCSGKQTQKVDEKALHYFHGIILRLATNS